MFVITSDRKCILNTNAVTYFDLEEHNEETEGVPVDPYVNLVAVVMNGDSILLKRYNTIAQAQEELLGLYQDLYLGRQAFFAVEEKVKEEA